MTKEEATKLGFDRACAAIRDCGFIYDLSKNDDANLSALISIVHDVTGRYAPTENLGYDNGVSWALAEHSKEALVNAARKAIIKLMPPAG